MRAIDGLLLICHDELQSHSETPGRSLSREISSEFVAGAQRVSTDDDWIRFCRTMLQNVDPVDVVVQWDKDGAAQLLVRHTVCHA